MKIIVKKELCQGHAMCQYKAHQLFEINEHGYNDMDRFDVPAGQEDATMCVGLRTHYRRATRRDHLDDQRIVPGIPDLDLVIGFVGRVDSPFDRGAFRCAQATLRVKRAAAVIAQL